MEYMGTYNNYYWFVFPVRFTNHLPTQVTDI